MSYTEMEIVGALLKGEASIFGVRVELTWPEGLPMPEDELRHIGEQWAPKDPWQQFFPANTRFCDATVRCAQVLADGKCSYHGERPA